MKPSPLFTIITFIDYQTRKYSIFTSSYIQIVLKMNSEILEYSFK